MLKRHAQIWTTAIALSALGLGLTACSAKSTPPGPPTTLGAGGSSSTTGASSTASACNGGSAGKSTTIDISNFTFLTCPDTVSPGATITVHNEDSVTHTLTSTSPAGAFNTGEIAGGSTKSFKAPTKPGTYDYDCTIHPFMLGTLIVS